MTPSKFDSTVKEVIELLDNISLFKDKGIKVINKDGVSQKFKTASQKGTYFDLYNSALANFDYDIILIDNSIFQFSYKSDDSLPIIRYAYFPNPQEYKSYEDFLNQLRINNIIEESNEEIGNLLEEEYEQFLNEQNLNSSITPIRYDVDEIYYKPLIHSVSHFHIGYDNDVRIPCNKILTPLNFTLFVIKHCYYYYWKIFIEQENSTLIGYINSSKSTCASLKEHHWDRKEEDDLFLT